MKQKIEHFDVGGVAGTNFTGQPQTATRQLVPVAGPFTISVSVVTAPTSWTMLIEGSHDGVYWQLLGTLTAAAGLDGPGPWPYIRCRTTAWAGVGEVQATICHVYDQA